MFFDINLVNNVELNALIQLRSTYEPLHPTPDDENVMAAMKKASYTDMRRFAAMQNNPEMAGIFMDSRCGRTTNRVNLSRTLELCRNLAVLRAADVLNNANPDASMQALNFTRNTAAESHVMMADLGKRTQTCKRTSVV